MRGQREREREGPCGEVIGPSEEKKDEATDPKNFCEGSNLDSSEKFT
jgi:hypothetical protein